MVLEAIKNFLFEKEVAVIHLIAVAIFSPLIFQLLRKLSTAIWKTINAIFGPAFKFIAKIKRRYIKNKLTRDECISIDKRLKNGGKLRWYEKKAYENEAKRGTL